MPRAYAVLIACAVLICVAHPAVAQPPLPVGEIFEKVFASPDSLAPYMTANAGREVPGHGRLEAVMPRATFDSSIPDSNPAVAVIHLASGRKVTCGLLKHLDREEFGGIREGASVEFTGKLVDAVDWGDWRTLYLSDCDLSFEK